MIKVMLGASSEDIRLRDEFSLTGPVPEVRRGSGFKKRGSN